MIAALRVGDRRWTLKLSSGIDVLLPDAGVDDALKTLIALESERSLLEREIAAVDLRLADRVSVRIRDKAEMTMPGNGSAVPETPTSSTKRNT
jgi:cell division protein FtsQ